MYPSKDQRESRPQEGLDQDPEAALEQLIAETGAGSSSDPLPILDGRFRRIDSDEAEHSDVVDSVNLRTSRGKEIALSIGGNIMKTWLASGEPKSNRMW